MIANATLLHRLRLKRAIPTLGYGLGLARVGRFHKNNTSTKSGAAPAPAPTTVGVAGGLTH